VAWYDGLMQAHRIETTVTTDGELNLKNVPVHAGDALEVIVLVKTSAANTSDPYPLRGTVIRYDDPTGPVAPGDWDAAR